ncbi:MAG: twin-arginine translocation signal domain-containing protein, partial [Nitrospira sp.]|nr:twin-arginine translocation signal domain-containing protein [Nitrospira sp.]
MRRAHKHSSDLFILARRRSVMFLSRRQFLKVSAGTVAAVAV